MKSSTIFLLTCLATALSLPGASPATVSAPITERNAEPGTLTEQAGCSYSTGCHSMAKSDSDWTGSGKYCGFCFQVQGTFVAGDIYQVNGGSGASSCCSYGASADCKARYAAIGKKYVKCKNTDKGY